MMPDEDTSLRLIALRQRLMALRREADGVEDEIAALESQKQLPLETQSHGPCPQTPAEKIALFLDLFGTRRSVYPKRWENPKTGKSGYSPACDNEWRKGLCGKPQVKCTECPHQKFPPLDVTSIEQHLRGIATLGVYAITENGACRFLAADFDGEGWQDNVMAYRDAGQKNGISIAVELSRSGNGAHAWIFFASPMPANIARKLGSLLLAKAIARHPNIGMETFDRFFPNQDSLPLGGFGNLIALPLAKRPRAEGKTLFLDPALHPIADQWAYLAKLPRLNFEQVQAIVSRLSPLVPRTISPPANLDDFVLQSDEAALDLSRPTIRKGMMTGELTLCLDSKIHIPRAIPAPVLAALKGLATFANPVFHEKLRLRFPTYNTPRFLFAGEWHPDRLVLPRGVLDQVLQILEDAGAEVQLLDQREKGLRCKWKFSEELRPEQAKAVREMERHEVGILCAPPGSGKTVMGCALVARHKTTALVLVHRTVLLDQWKQTAMGFLGLKRREVGIWRGSKPRLTHKLDLAMLPSLSRTADFSAAFSGYGLVLVDECHHVPAATFELLLKACPARRIIGLTATPYRKDRLEKLLHLQCGPIRYDLQPTIATGSESRVFVRQGSITLPPGPVAPAIHGLWAALAADKQRLKRIGDDVRLCIEEGRSPLILADRRLYLDRIEEALVANGETSTIPRYRLESAVGKKARVEIRQRVDAHYENGEPFVLLATASLVGEGFDLPQLDTLILAMPLSFKGRLIQYAGRLHRSYEGKASPRIYDYLDTNHPITRAMFERRLAGYRQMGYEIEMDTSQDEGLFAEAYERNPYQ